MADKAGEKKADKAGEKKAEKSPEKTEVKRIDCDPSKVEVM